MKNYSYFDNEQGDYTISYRVNTEEETYIAITDTAEKAGLICKALNLVSYNPELLDPNPRTLNP